MTIPPVLHRLLTAPGPSGAETGPAGAFREAAGAFAEVETDLMGSTVATVRGAGTGRSVAIFGHIDEIGLVVHHIDDDGSLHVRPIGGWDPVVLVGQRMEVLAAAGRVPGVIGTKPHHLMSHEDHQRRPDMADLRIDIGAESREEAGERVEAGDVVVVAGEPLTYPRRRIVSRSLDNRVGAYVALEAARALAADGGAPGDVFAVASAQEEINLAGALTTAHRLRPDVAIVVDVGHVPQPGVEAGDVGAGALGGGPIITRGPTFNPALVALLRETARTAGIPYTLRGSAGRTGTDADVVHLCRAGVPCVLVEVPLRYMHSPVEMVQLDDVEAAIALVVAYVRALTKELDLARSA